MFPNSFLIYFLECSNRIHNSIIKVVKQAINHHGIAQLRRFSNRLIIWRLLVQALDVPQVENRICDSLLFFWLAPTVISFVLFVCTGFADSKQRSRWVSLRRISSPRCPTSRESHSRFSIFFLGLPPAVTSFVPYVCTCL